MLRRLLAIILCLLPVVASAQPVQEPWFQAFLPGRGNIVRAYHLDRSGTGSSDLCDTTVGCPTLGIWFDDAVAATYTTEIGSYVMTVNGNPTRVAAGTWPAGFTGSPGYAWRMDGTGDYLSIADAAAFEPSDFSVFACIVPRAGIAANDVYVAKSNATGNKRSWSIYTPSDATRVSLLVSDDGTINGGHTTTLSKAASTAANRLTCFTVAYDYVADGSSVANIWVDELAVATSSAMDGPLFNSDAAFTIGADGAGSGDIPSEFFVVGFYPGSLVASDHLRLARRFRGLYDGSGSQVVSFTAATPPALQVAAPADGVTPFLVDMPANSGMLGKTASCSGVYGASAITNKCWRSSLETWAAGAPTGWTEAVTSDGNCESSTLSPAHGSTVAACSTTDADDAVTLTSGCATVTGGTAMRLMAWAKTGSGAGLLDVNIIEDDSADCATPTTTTAVINDQVPGAAWARYAGNITLQAGSIRAQVQISLPAAAAQVTYVDAVQFRAGSVASDAYCGADTDADAVCATSIPSHASALSANGSQTVEMTACTPWAGTDVTATTFMWSDGNTAAGSPNTFGVAVPASTDEFYSILYDAASGGKSNAPNTANWAASTPYTVRWYMSGLGGLGVTWPVGTWYTTTAGAGTGKRTAAQTVTYIGASNTAGTDTWVTGLTYFRGWLR